MARRSGKSNLSFFIFVVVLVAFLLIRGGVGTQQERIQRRSLEHAAPAELYDLTGPVMDMAGMLSQETVSSLSSYLMDLDAKSGVQIAVLTVPSLGEDSIEDLSLRYAEKWQLGQAGCDNGALLLVALNEHAVRIETGYGTEGALTDALCSRIIRTVLVPAFQKGDYDGGIITAVTTMAGIITNDDALVERLVSESHEDESDSIGILPAVSFIVWLLILIFAITRGNRTARTGSTVVNTGMLRSRFSDTTFHSGGGSGQGFHGGGGRFGGGGATGHW